MIQFHIFLTPKLSLRTLNTAFQPVVSFDPYNHFETQEAVNQSPPQNCQMILFISMLVQLNPILLLCTVDTILISVEHLREYILLEVFSSAMYSIKAEMIGNLWYLRHDL